MWVTYIWVGSAIWKHLQLPSPLLGFPDSSVGKESICNAGDPGSIPGSGTSTGEGIGCPLQYSWASLVAQLVKKSTCNAGYLGSIPGLGRSPGERKGYPFQYSGLENSMNHIAHGHDKMSGTTERLSLPHCQKWYGEFKGAKAKNTI